MAFRVQKEDGGGQLTQLYMTADLWYICWFYNVRRGEFTGHTTVTRDSFTSQRI